MSTSSNLIWAALAIGAVTGMRSMLAPTLVSRALSERDDLAGAGEAAQLLTSDTAQTFLPVLAASEMIGDKMPFAPDRTIVPSMMFRALSGGASAAALAGVRREPVLLPALLGATAARRGGRACAGCCPADACSRPGSDRQRGRAAWPVRPAWLAARVRAAWPGISG